eukprot:6677575-Pyramimonas_sp.AAC.1
MAICPSALTVSTACSTSRSDVALAPLRALTGLSALRWFHSGRPWGTQPRGAWSRCELLSVALSMRLSH